VRKVRVDRRKIQLEEPIKRVGRYEVPVEVFQDVVVPIKTLVVPEGGDISDLEAYESEAETAGPGAETVVSDELPEAHDCEEL